MTFTDYEVVQPTDKDWMLCSSVPLGIEAVGAVVVCCSLMTVIGHYNDGSKRYSRPKCRLLKDKQELQELEVAQWDDSCWLFLARINRMLGPGRFEILPYYDDKTEVAFVTDTPFEYDENYDYPCWRCGHNNSDCQCCSID